MNISTVSELIAALESAGELSIREQKFLKLAKAFKQLAAENKRLTDVAQGGAFVMQKALMKYEFGVGMTMQAADFIRDAREKHSATDRIVAGIKADGRVEGAHFVANRMLAAWDAGFIEDSAKNAADIARMILTSTEFMADAPEGDFDRSFADGILEDIAKQLREGGDK